MNNHLTSSKAVRTCRNALKRFSGLIFFIVITMLFPIDSIYAQTLLTMAKPNLGFSVTGPRAIKVATPTEEIKISLVNQGATAPNSRLRIFIHDHADRDLRRSDIQLAVKSQENWQEVPVEAIDGGVMGAVGEDQKVHAERHAGGGFRLSRQQTKRWQVRLTLQKAGIYTLVVAISPDNGATQLVKPVSLTVEAL